MITMWTRLTAQTGPTLFEALPCKSHVRPDGGSDGLILLPSRYLVMWGQWVRQTPDGAVLVDGVPDSETTTPVVPR